jgi:hypothetical protein
MVTAAHDVAVVRNFCGRYEIKGVQSGMTKEKFELLECYPVDVDGQMGFKLSFFSLDSMIWYETRHPVTWNGVKLYFDIYGLGNPKIKRIYPPYPKKSDIYCVEIVGHDLLKIGYSAQAAHRVKSLETAIPFELKVLACFPGTRQDERAFHIRFKHLNCRNEWFYKDDSILEALKEASIKNRRYYQ